MGVEAMWKGRDVHFCADEKGEGLTHPLSLSPSLDKGEIEKPRSIWCSICMCMRVCVYVCA
jgi:hypothetical protein